MLFILKLPGSTFVIETKVDNGLSSFSNALYKLNIFVTKFCFVMFFSLIK
jgi:hypothetical protein